MRAYRIVFAVWISIWLLFFIQQVLWRGKFIDTCCRLVRLNREQRRAEAYGKDYYAFLKFCRANLPEKAKFQLIGPPEWSVDRVRAHFFLYPSLLSEKPEFILVYKNPSFRVGNTTLIGRFSNESYVLRVDK